MEIRAAKLEDREEVLKTVDEFNDFANSQGNNRNKPSSFSQKYSIGLYNEIVSSNRSKLFIAFNQDQVVGYLEIHQVPRLRKAKYYGEIEGMFVKKAYQGTGIATQLMEAARSWAKTEGLDCIRLYSGHGLDRAHAFYEKMGFIHAGKTYRLIKF
ncbi:hypothetical protein A2313_04995 [Candidatus Roizmanbacteria bacterium RIFOXYB2_FULL_41_10]|uniref:N-acetyltransferase domain-containing protein n=1 Tax=Candidatus Roizmanbacteria bacterium RIFOXYA1_FULL_41_12 TaxID=1802082 RepID=A0A1F7KFJ1_9BACT|nr:MAG: hypothetical protein A2209_00070 [Candidatus Roizmanbacteria bacterium RIFOXYA1_FULL_41_12]OGK67638.1 MAG: hypothetical protein A2377_00705 [Candidatus Roizmanbacteria bacterium RIFOXYB1_FULL_41_27]OGK67892.1 MAG: hypothetical protein A2262_00685 [Candidatus Roizmanbacteria bacterium RIFOXYA2_FULL_41_8]OGK69361.1 MAG: hypothetical protein A2313_04995 [Candidatus Roizmanbacteria bacterium RIFOXYB2_FULL_41_10]OGK71360.1 MAG: hypothetical protein A2403_01090 [Candidatus Roizmanbacteria bac